MRNFIDQSTFSLQVERNRENVASTDAIAVSNGVYDKDLSYDLPPTEKTPMGMDKDGNQTLENKVWTDITNWTIRSGFPGTVITNNGLVVAEAQRANISVNLNYLFPSNSGNGMVGIHNAIRIVINGSVVKETTSERIISPKTGFTTDLNVGDVIKIQLWTNFWRLNSDFSTTYLSAILNASLSYVTFAPAKTGVVDFQNDLVFAEETKFIEKDNAIYVMPDGSKKTLPMTGATSNWTGSTSTNVQVTKPFGEDYITDVSVSATPTGSNTISQTTSVNLGPVLAQSKIPYPVSEGMLVNMSGTLYVRRSGNQEKTEDDGATGLMVRFALWGKGKESDEYGENDVDIELMWYQAELQNSNLNQSRTTMSYSLPQVEDVVIPPNIEKVYFTAALKQTVGDTYASASFENPVKLGSPSAYFGTPYSDPLAIKIQLPSLEQNTYKHPLSTTGVAFKNRKYFDHMQIPKNLTFFGNNSAVSLDIYKSSNMVRGALIGSYGASPGERKTITVESDTGNIELVSADPYWVEKCTPIKKDEFLEEIDFINKYEYQEVSDLVSSIKIERSEADSSFMYVNFLGYELDPSTAMILVPGRRIRLLSTTENFFDNVFTGIIRKVETKYNFEDEPYIKATIYDSLEKLDRTNFSESFDKIDEFSPIVNSLGIKFKINNIDFSGKRKKMPNGLIYKPSAVENSQTLLDSLIKSRNTTKSFLWCNRNDEIIISSTLPTQIKEFFSDNSADSDLSFSSIDLSSNTESIVNVILVNENKFDSKELNERTVESEIPLKNINYMVSKNETAKFLDEDSVDTFGEYNKSFDVVRGSGELADIKKEDFGSGFNLWAEDILNKTNSFTPNIGSISTNPINKNQIQIISSLDLLDLIRIKYLGRDYLVYIREITHEISPGKWATTFSFKPTGDSVYWTPEV